MTEIVDTFLRRAVREFINRHGLSYSAKFLVCLSEEIDKIPREDITKAFSNDEKKADE